MHDDGKFDCVNGIARRKHIIVDNVRYLRKESNNLDKVMTIGIENGTLLEFINNKNNDQEMKKIHELDIQSFTF